MDYEFAVEARGLEKSYGARKAVDGIDLRVPRGKVFALLGPNGAGKTTTLEILEGLRRRDAGTLRFFGEEVAEVPPRAKARMGAQLQSGAFFPHLKAREVVELMGSLYPASIGAGELIERFGLGEQAEAPAGSLSGGQAQRLALACALVNDPELVFLDEPTTGLDPQSRRALWASIRSLREEGRTVLLTTHYMEEAAELADLAAIVDGGKVLASGKPAEISDGHANLEEAFLALTGRELRN